MQLLENHKNFKYLKIKEYNAKDEFFNEYFKVVFEKILTEFEYLFEKNI